MKSKVKNRSRENEHDVLCSDLAAFGSIEPGTASFGVIGISGYGGVGKTFLLDDVLRQTTLELADALIIRVDGSNPKILRDFAAMVDYQLAPRSLPAPAKPKDYFNLTRRLVHALYRLNRGVESEIDRKQQLEENVKKVAKSLYRVRPFIAKIPKAGPSLNVLLGELEKADAHKHVPDALEALSELRSLRASRGLFGHKSAREIVRYDPYNSIADAYRGDVQAALVGYRKKDRKYALPGVLEGKNRLLLIVDDFETTGDVFGDFLVESLLKALQGGPFPTLAIFIGRDDLAEEHTGFNQHFNKTIVRKINVQPFELDDGIRYLRKAGYQREEAETIYKKCAGYPFLLSLFAEHRSNAEQQTALFYQRFFERTTHWMTGTEKDWFLTLSYLDKINKATIESMLPNAEPNVVLEWFRKEGSVRDVNAEHYAVQPFIREMIMAYHRNLIGTKDRLLFEDRARLAMEDA